ncbi:MAG: ABC transporter permease [Fimbriimonadaceae bacterium]|nr:ABC transporter permease [Fimbriimonadaceae bacterium]
MKNRAALSIALPIALIILALFVGSKVSPNFLDSKFLMESLTLMAEVGIVAVAMNYVISTGNIDLSVGSNVVLTACLTAKLIQAGTPPAVGIALGILIGTGLGVINGILITQTQVPSFLITVATMAVYRGIAQALMGSASASIPEAYVGIDTITFAGLTVPLLLLLATALISAFIFSRTIFGRWMLALGSNASAALYSGVPVKRVTFLVFAITGLASGIAAVLMDSRLGLARHDFAKGFELDAITMVVIGGTAIRGGDSNIVGTLLAFILIGLLRTTMGIANVTAEYQLTAVGILLIFAVLFNRIELKSKARKD